MGERPRILVAPGVTGEAETAMRVIELGNRYGQYTSLSTVALDAYDPAPEGQDTPELTFPGGHRIGGRALTASLEDGSLETHFQNL